MHRRILVVSMLLASLLAFPRCQVSVSIPEGKLRSVAQDTLSVAHPMATFTGARLAGGSAGCGSGERYVDLDIDYKGAFGGAHTLRVRYHVESLDPCRVRPEKVQDTSAVPAVMLNVLGEQVGMHVCESLR